MPLGVGLLHNLSNRTRFPLVAKPSASLLKEGLEFLGNEVAEVLDCRGLRVVCSVHSFLPALGSF